jgi:hypothetical protein
MANAAAPPARRRRPRSAFTGYGEAMPRSRERGGFGFWGPFPSYSRRTRGGGSIRVTGCCLPLALGLGGALLVGPLAVWRRARGH